LKPQYVDLLAKTLKGTVKSVVDLKCRIENPEKFIQDLDMCHLMDRQISDLSGGELQRFAILATVIQSGNIYMFDEPSSYLDVKQRIQIARVIRSILRYDNYVIAVSFLYSL
jgi:ATP-binding cassette, sub-family E, member 1